MEYAGVPFDEETVSIPLWCDLKMLYLPGARENLRVSIPLWCDLKVLAELALAVPEKAVSIPLWCDLKATPTGCWWGAGPVSIPLWCDLKLDAGLPGALTPSRFHPTMVRFKGSARMIYWSWEPGFHPTMVRFKATPSWRSSLTAGGSFPSHYGAI